MAVSLGRFSRWFLGGKEKEPVSNGSFLNSYSDSCIGLREPDSVKFPAKSLAPPRKVKKKWQRRSYSSLGSPRMRMR